MAELFAPGTPVDFNKKFDASTLKGRSALVTGGASGIGLALVHALLENGAHVTIADLNENTGKSVVETLRGNGHEVTFVKTDVTNWDDQVAAFEKAASNTPDGTIDIVITSAGIEGKLETLPPLQDLDKPVKPPTLCVDVNFYGTYYSAILALWHFARSPPNPAKQLLFVCSLAGYSSPPEKKLSGDYSASKFAVRALFHQLHLCAKQYGGARVNMISPTFVDTPLLQPGVLEIVQASGIKTAVTADVVDGAMRCLCDGEVNGRSIAIGGGEANGGKPGEANFDICDDVLNHMGGKVLLENMSKLITLPGS